MIAIKSLSLFVAFLLELAVLTAAGLPGIQDQLNLPTNLLAGLGTPAERARLDDLALTPYYADTELGLDGRDRIAALDAQVRRL